MSYETDSLLTRLQSLENRLAEIELRGNDQEASGGMGDRGGILSLVGLPSELEGDEDSATVRGLIYPDAAGTVACKELTWWHPDGAVTSTATTGLGSPTNKYIIATRTLTTLTISATSSLPAASDVETKILLATLSYNGANQVNGIMRHHTGDIFPPYGGLVLHPFRFSQTSDTGGAVEWGSVAVNGVLKTVADWTNYGTGANLTLSSVTTTTRYYIEIDYVAGTATWKSTTSAFPDGTLTKDIWPILTVTCASSKISAVKRHQWSDIHARSSGSTGVLHAFKFTQTASTGGTVSHGSVFLAGVAKTLSGWTDHGTGADLTLTSITSTTRYYVAVELATATASWNSTTSAFPASDADTEIVEILTIPCVDSVIDTANIKQHQCSNIRLPANV